MKVKITCDDCRSCGACCVGSMDDGHGWADCTEEDVVRMTRSARARLVPIRYGFTFNPAILATPTKMTPEFGKVCSFLRGTPGKRVSCSIYETRPTVCAKYKPGGEGCRQARAEMELPH